MAAERGPRITRRDFLNGVAIGGGGAVAAASVPEFVVAAIAASSSPRVVMPPRRPDLQASAQRALY